MERHLQVAVDCSDPHRLARFWAEVLGYVVQDPPEGHADWAEFSRAEGGAGEAWCAVVDPHGSGPRVLFHSVPEPKSGKNRLHLDVRIGRQHVDTEAARLVSLGATHVRTVEDTQDYFAVLRDPEGNEFCLC